MGTENLYDSNYCETGSLGALCEDCDYNGVFTSGKVYVHDTKYTCMTCADNFLGSILGFIIILVSIMVFVCFLLILVY